MTRQQKLDAFARKKGYPSYFAYRNAMAKAEGFSSYSAKRRAGRKTPLRPGPSNVELPNLPDQAPRFLLSHPAANMSRDMRMAYREAGRTTTDAALESARTGNLINRQGVVMGNRSAARRDQILRPVLGKFDELDQRVKDFYTHDFPKVYAAGARSANPKWSPTAADRKVLADLTKEGAGALIQTNAAARRNARTVLPRLFEMDGTRATKIAKNRPVKGPRYKDGRELGFDTHAAMVLRANTARAFNIGFLNAARASGASKFIVSDGSDCGWNNHTDPQKANGMVVSIDMALSRPIAHPNCVRQFSVAPKDATLDEGLGRRAGRAAAKFAKESAAATAKANAVSLAMHLVTDERVQGAARRVAAGAKADFIQYRANLAIVARLYEHSRRTKIAAMGNVTDIRTLTPAAVSSKAVADDVMAWIEDFADGGEVPEHVLRIIGAPAQAGRRVIGDSLEDFTTFYNSAFNDKPAQIRPIQRRMSTVELGRPTGQRRPPRPPEGPPTTTERLVKQAASKVFFDWLGPRIPQYKYLRLTFPNVNKSLDFIDRPHRFSTGIGDLVKVTRTSIRDRGVINHISLNPNGLLRASFTKDPETGFITPTFRLIPPGPLHLMTRVNRGKKGNITSLSTELRLITKAPVLESVTARFNLNLRKLGLTSWEDVKKVTKEDLAKFSKEDLRGVSAAANMRARGFNIFDISRTFRLPWEETEKLWYLSGVQLGDMAAEIKARQARKKFVAIAGTRLSPLPTRPPGTTRPILRIVDPETGDPFGPGPAASQAQKISVPSTLRSTTARRAYIEARLTQAERNRVASMRLAGDVSTIRFLRDTDKLTWFDISVRMRMSEGRVRKLYKEGT